MSSIKHTKGDVTLERSGAGPNTQSNFTVEGQTSDARQSLVINSPKVIEDLKAIIGQVEQAAKVLGQDVLVDYDEEARGRRR